MINILNNNNKKFKLETDLLHIKLKDLQNKTYFKREISTESFLTVLEISEHLKLSKQIIYQLVNNGDIPCILINKNIRIKKSDYLRFLEKNYIDNKKDKS